MIGGIAGLAVRSLINRRGTVALVLLATALSVTLFVGVEKIRTGARESFESTISGADLVVGARSGAVNLLLYAIFHVGDATADVSMESYQAIAERPEVEWTVPFALGDSHRGFRVVGTTSAFFGRYRYGDDQPLRFAAGEPFSDLFDAVIGADVARELGYGLDASLVVAHGLGDVSFAQHSARPFRVAGVLARTGTPVDRSIYVSLEGVEAMHVGWETGVRAAGADALTADQLRALDLRPDRVTAFIVGLKSRSVALRLQRDINTYGDEALLAVIPGVALAELWEVVGVAERALASISVFVVLVGLTGVLAVILTGLNERRREMAILRALGARPWHIFALLVIEAALVGFVGAAIGLAAFYGVFALAAPWIETRFGLALAGVGPSLFDLGAVGGVTLAAAALGAVPAWRAFRNALADGLTIRM
jgi:putative ABC transport system permease protein